MKTKRVTFKQKLEFLNNFDQLSVEEKKNVADKYGIDVNEVKEVLEDECYDCYKLSLNHMIILFKEVEKMICEKSDQINSIERVNNKTIDEFLYHLLYGIEWDENKKKINNEIDMQLDLAFIAANEKLLYRNNYYESSHALYVQIVDDAWKKYDFQLSDKLNDLLNKLNKKL